MVAFGQSCICESWTGLCTSSRSRCRCTGTWSNAFSPRIGFQRSTWRTLTFTFRSFRDTDRFYGLRSKVGHGSTRSSPSGTPCLPRVFTKVVEGALTPLREVGVRILNYLDDWLILAQSLKVYVAVIAAHHDAVDGRSLGKHDLIVRFLKGARRMNPSRPPLVPTWNLSIILAGLQRGPFEPLDSVELKFLSLKTALLTALTSIKWVGDLQAFSVSEECLVFRPVYSHVVLRPRPGYVPKVPTAPFRDQVVNLQALPSEEEIQP